MRDTVLFLDTTLRDGEQTPGVSFHLNDKVDFAMFGCPHFTLEDAGGGHDRSRIRRRQPRGL